MGLLEAFKGGFGRTVIKIAGTFLSVMVLGFIQFQCRLNLIQNFSLQSFGTWWSIIRSTLSASRFGIFRGSILFWNFLNNLVNGIKLGLGDLLIFGLIAFVLWGAGFSVVSIILDIADMSRHQETSLLKRVLGGLVFALMMSFIIFLAVNAQGDPNMNIFLDDQQRAVCEAQGNIPLHVDVAPVVSAEVFVNESVDVNDTTNTSTDILSVVI